MPLSQTGFNAQDHSLEIVSIVKTDLSNGVVYVEGSFLATSKGGIYAEELLLKVSRSISDEPIDVDMAEQIIDDLAFISSGFRVALVYSNN